MKSLSNFGLAALLTACASSPPTHFFTLDPVQTAHGVTDASGVAVQVGAVHVPPELDRQQMVHQSAPNTLTISDQNRWAAPLADMVRDVLTQDLMQRLPKGRVISPESGVPAGACVIAVDILQFRADAAGMVTFDGSWSLSAAGSEAPVSIRHVVLSEPVSRNDDAGRALAMSTLVGRLSDEIATALPTSAQNPTR